MTNSVDLASLILQIINLEMLFKDFNNTDLMKTLQIIINQNNKIIELLERNESNGRINEKY